MTRQNRTHGAGWLVRLLALGQIFMGFVLAATALWLLATLPVWWSDPPRLPLNIEVAINPETDFITLDLESSPFREYELGRITGELKVKLAGAWAQWIYLVFALLEIVLIFLILHFLRKIVRSVSTGEIFSGVNAKRLRWVGSLLIIESLFYGGASALITGMNIHDLNVTGSELTVHWFLEISHGGFISGWILLILSEVFRQGAEMKQDQSLTI